jgi:hypothetical protein
MDWVPDENLHSDKEHPLHTIRKSDRVIDMKKILHSIPVDELEEIEGFISDKLKARADKTQ